MTAITRLCLLVVVSAASLTSFSCSGGSSQSARTSYTIGGTVSKLASGNSLQLQNNGDTLTVNANGKFTFATTLTSESSYNVTVSIQPSSPAQTCGVTNGSGTATADVTNIAVDCGHNEWTWMSGANVVNQAGTYGTLGTAAASNVPGARVTGAAWTDSSGNFWLFGGLGIDSAAAGGDLSDLWEYSSGQWTWAGGPDIVNQAGAYGTQGTAAAGNVPGARNQAVTWIDSTGNFWLFGGLGLDSTGTTGYLNDLWEYSGGQWTWVSGANVVNQAGTYGTQGTAAVSNVPGARDQAVTWIDSKGNFWLFGGLGLDSTGTTGYLNDLWEYSGGQWTWVSGANVVNQAGTYGTQGTAAATNVPGARDSKMTWTDTSGNFWLFGGYGYDSTGAEGQINDLWEYSGGQWTWVSGANVVNQPGTYGTQGTAGAGNVPGARNQAVTWIDSTGNFWLFGGYGYDSTGAEGRINDLWKYSSGQWIWVSGANVANQQGTYGTEGTPAPGNVPGARWGPVAWEDKAGNLWIFGGKGYDSTGAAGELNDLWTYEP